MGRRNFNKKNKKSKTNIFKVLLFLSLLLGVAFLGYDFLVNKKVLLKPEYHIVFNSNKYINTGYFLNNGINIGVNFSNKTNIVISSNSEKRPDIIIPEKFILKEYKLENINSYYYHIFELEFINNQKPKIAIPNDSGDFIAKDKSRKTKEEQSSNNINNNINNSGINSIKNNNNISKEKELEKLEKLEKYNNNELFLSGNINIDSLKEKRLENSKYLREQKKIKEVNIVRNTENLAIQKIEEDIGNSNLDLDILRKKIIKEQGLVRDNSLKEYIFTINSSKTNIVNFKLKTIRVGDLYAKYSNLDNNVLTILKLKLVKEIDFLDNLNIRNNKVLEILKIQKLKNKNSLLKLIKNILETRTEKYLTPVVGVLPSEAWYAVPNANRGYRSDITDGIHHGWDAYASIGHKIVAITDGVIIRIRDNFKWKDLDLINKKVKIDLEGDYNLDIFRGNQLWLKLADGNIVFYSHFSEFKNNIYEGKIVKKGDILGKVGITGVPEKNYSNSHLHFAVMHNNLLSTLNLIRYDFSDILGWDWLYKGLGRDELILKQRKLFYTNSIN